MKPEAHGLLVLLDGSRSGDRALDRALDLARERDMPVTLLAIVPPRLWRGRQGQFQIPPDKHDEEFARALLASGHAKARARKVKAAERLRTGSPARVIEEETARGFELVVIGERRNLAGAPSLVNIVRDTLGDKVEIVPEE